MTVDHRVEAIEKIRRLEEEVSKVIVGQKELIHSILITLLTDGHLLIEGLPGLAKTLAVTTFAKAIACDCKRIQFTPDLLPADLIGTSVYNPKEGTFSIKEGPLFTNILLADEINRAPPKVQSALLEAMQERQVTIAGTTFKAKNPFLVLATQNPIELEGTYPLPEAQVDRFMMKVKLNYLSFKEEGEVLDRMAKIGPKPTVNTVMTAEELLECRKQVDLIYADPKISHYILSLVFATRTPEKWGVDAKGLIAYGASPRAGIFLLLGAKAQALLQGRDFVKPEDVQKVAMDILRHRIKVTYEAEAEEISSEEIIKRILERVVTP